MKTLLRLYGSDERPKDCTVCGKLYQQGNMWNFTGNIRHRKINDTKIVTDFQVKIIYWEWVIDINFLGFCIWGHWRTSTSLRWYNTQYFEFEFAEEITYQTCS